MAEQTRKIDTQKNNRSKSKIVTAVAVLFVLITILIIFLCTKNILFFSLSQRFVLNRDFETAENLTEMCNSDESKLLGTYIDLRQDINYYYALMLSDLNIEKLREWQNIAATVKKGSSIFNEQVKADAEKLSDTLDNICANIDEPPAHSLWRSCPSPWWSWAPASSVWSWPALTQPSAPRSPSWRPRPPCCPCWTVI